MSEMSIQRRPSNNDPWAKVEMPAEPCAQVALSLGAPSTFIIPSIDWPDINLVPQGPFMDHAHGVFGEDWSLKRLIRPDIGKTGTHSMFIPKIVGEDYVADNSLGCATDGRKESKIGRNL